MNGREERGERKKNERRDERSAFSDEKYVSSILMHFLMRKSCPKEIGRERKKEGGREKTYFQRKKGVPAK